MANALHKATLGLVVIAIAFGIASLVLNIIILTKQKDNNNVAAPQTPAPELTTTAPPPATAPKTSAPEVITAAPPPTTAPKTSAPEVTTAAPPPATPKPTISGSEGFKAAAQYLLKGIDTTFDPCEDFYLFSCNTYLKNNPVPNDDSRIGTYDESQRIVNKAISDYLNGTVNQQSKTDLILQKVFKSCMEVASLESVDKTLQMNSIINKLFNSIPMFNATWVPLSDEQFWNSIGALELNYALPTLLQSYVTVDYKNSSRNALFINQLPLAMARDYYVKPQFINNLDGYLASLIGVVQKYAQDIKATVNIDDITKAVTDAARLETVLAIASVPDELLRNYEQQYNAYTLNDLKNAYPKINWDSYLNSTVLQGGQSRDEYVIQQPSYVGTLNTILTGNQFSQATFVNFLIIKFIANNAQFLGATTTKEEENEYKNLRKMIKTVKGESSQEEDNAYDCVSVTEGLMPYANGYIYLKTINPKERTDTQTDVAQQTQFIIQEFLGMIKTLAWLTPQSYDAAKTKSEGLKINVGWPDWFNFDDSTFIDNYHSQYANILNLDDWWSILGELQKAFQITENFGQLDKVPDRKNFLASPATVNAWYQPERNSITFPYAAFNPPYYRHDFPQAYNYAGQGGTAGHELTHGYDDEGVQFGPTGELTPCEWNHCGWMDKNSTNGFTDMAQCVVSQFSQQCCPLKTGNVHCANGESTQGENIADLGGQLAAFKAYRRYVKEVRNGVEEDRLPGLEQFTPNQIFWLTYGYSWCMSYGNSVLVRQLLTNPHAPGMCRVNQVMQDIPEFGEAFGCKSGSAMFPPSDQRCHVWTA